MPTEPKPPAQDATLITDPDAAGTQDDTAPTEAVAPRKPAGKKKSEGELNVDHLGDFQLIKKLGQGGMGSVYLAHQVSLDRKVALKVMSQDFSNRPNFVERFVREARTMAKLDHPNIVRGYAVGEDQGHHFVAMELIDGKSMQDWLNKLKRLSVGDALHVAIKAADALQHAHDINLIHRDVKPDNMLVTTKGVLKVSDLGLAKQIDEDQGMTQSGIGLGTPYYMPPEQARNAKHVDARCDIYALGSTLYHFLTGAYPYSANSTVELLMAKETKNFTSANRINPEIPERLSLIIDKMMAREPKNRYQTCADVIRALEGLGLANASLSFITGGVPEKMKPAGAATAPPAAAATRPEPAAPQKPAGSQVWYVKHTDARGKTVVARLSTEKTLQILKSGQLDIKAKISKTGKDDFVPLAQVPEFQSAVQNRIVKAKAEKTAGKFDDLYKKIEKDEIRRRRWGWIGRYFESAKGMVSLAVYLAILCGVGYGLYWLVMKYAWPLIAEKFHLS